MLKVAASGGVNSTWNNPRSPGGIVSERGEIVKNLLEYWSEKEGVIVTSLTVQEVEGLRILYVLVTEFVMPNSGTVTKILPSKRDDTTSSMPCGTAGRAAKAVEAFCD